MGSDSCCPAFLVHTVYSVVKHIVHLNFVDGIVDFLTPHRDAPLIVSVDPAVLTETLRLKAGKRLVVRNSHRLLSRHGR